MGTSSNIFVMIILLQFSTFLAIVAGLLFITVATVKIECNRFKNTKYIDKLKECRNKLLVKQLFVVICIIIVNAVLVLVSISIPYNIFIHVLLFILMPVVLTLFIITTVNKKLIAEFRNSMSKYK